jgi:very-short-patch-repair endonuclease
MHDKTQTQRGQWPVAELAGRQFGVVTTAQLEALGWSRSRAADAALTGRLHRVHQGVYAVGNPVLSPHACCMAAVLACGDDALLSHFSAAWLWGIAHTCAMTIDVTAANVCHHQKSIRVHSAQTLTDDDRDSKEGIPVTAVPRTLLDLAATAPRYLGWLVENTRKLGLLDFPSFDELLARSKGQRGVRRLRLALEEHREPETTRSKVERLFLRLVKRAGLPRPSVNLFVAEYELDVYWHQERFAVELDTYKHHGDRLSFEEDRKRHEDLKLAGIEMVRITGTRIEREPVAVVRRLRQLINQRRQSLGLPLH